MSNPWGDSASVYFFYVILGIIGTSFFYLLYKCIKNRIQNCNVPNSQLTTNNAYEEISSRNSSVDKIFNEFQNSVIIKPTDSLNTSTENQNEKKAPKIIQNRRQIVNSLSVLEEGMKKTKHINALLNLLAIKEIGEVELKEHELDLLKNRVKIFTHEDFKSDNLNNTTSNIENLSQSFCLNNDEKIRNKPSCMYCLENLNIGDKVIYLNVCIHVFHECCCLDWFSKKSYCPICRKHPLFDNDDVQILDPSNFMRINYSTK